MDKCLVLSSGGVDSTTCISLALNKFDKNDVATVSIYYGQKHDKELKCAKAIAKYYDLNHYELDLRSIFAQSNCSLLKTSTESIPETSYAEQLQNSEFVSTYVPFRNGTFLASIASFAMSLYPNDVIHVYLGAHADDAAGNAYPDCSIEFTNAMNEAIKLGTGHKVILETPLVRLNKSQVVTLGLKYNTPYELTWSCYKGGSKPCGTCGTCLDRARAFKENGINDPALNGGF